MGKKLGICCIILGMICILASVGLICYNRYESRSGAESSRNLLQNVQAQIKEEPQNNAGLQETATEETLPEAPAETTVREMVTVPVGDYDSIGILSIPVLELELPVLTDWSYPKLKKAPCHYYGSCYESDFVIAAHNYPAHFGRLSELRQGDLVVFTDGAGEVHCYAVVLLETLLPTATEEMITSGFDLSLYTCTPGGGNRVTVRCVRMDN